ncbi:NAD(P)-dependent oxidoreductase [Rhizobium sp. LjRoot30]|uniref:NAD-dependent epimerase/dehydratase family protein n=1 Tax=Rhizobium sp. LjRoot30 TaxID=3342320 RepID=UPI003ECEB2A3
MRVLVSGGTGLVGRYIVEELLRAGYVVTIGGRRPPSPDLFSRHVDYIPLFLDAGLDQAEAFDQAYLFVHAAFDHVPGKYRGGEGDDPAAFLRRNLEGSIRLFETAKRAGTRRCIFLSSRAVYGTSPSGIMLSEEMEAAPESLYGSAKLQAERALATLSSPGFTTASLRLTGVYGDLQPGKWDALIADYRAGRPVAARAGTEVHGRDAAFAVRLMLETEAGRIDGQSFNVSDMVTDTRDILSVVKDELDCPHPLPEPADRTTINEMTTAKIRALGWHGGGRALLTETLRTLARRMSA